jgi:hypothetical protein
MQDITLLIKKQPASASVQLEHPDDLNVLAQTIWGEARQDGTKGMIAVWQRYQESCSSKQSNVRSRHQRCLHLEAKQFSCWKPWINREKSLKTYYNMTRLYLCVKAQRCEPFNEWFQKFKNTAST